MYTKVSKNKFFHNICIFSIALFGLSGIVKTTVINEDWKTVEARLGFSFSGSGASAGGGAKSTERDFYNKIYHEGQQRIVYGKDGKIDNVATEKGLMDFRNDILQKLSDKAPSGGIKLSGEKPTLSSDIPSKEDMRLSKTINTIISVISFLLFIIFLLYV
jgi:hypothetical protein